MLFLLAFGWCLSKILVIAGTLLSQNFLVLARFHSSLVARHITHLELEVPSPLRQGGPGQPAAQPDH